MVASNLHSGLGPGYKWATQAVLEALSGKVPNNVLILTRLSNGRSVLAVEKHCHPIKEVESHPGYGPTDLVFLFGWLPLIKILVLCFPYLIWTGSRG